MDHLWAEILKQGVLGIVICLLIFAIVTLWRKLAERDAAIAALQESRLLVMQKTTEALVNASASMTKQAENNAEINESLRQIAVEYQQRRSGR